MVNPYFEEDLLGFSYLSTGYVCIFLQNIFSCLNSFCSTESYVHHSSLFNQRAGSDSLTKQATQQSPAALVKSKWWICLIVFFHLGVAS